MASNKLVWALGAFSVLLVAAVITLSVLLANKSDEPKTSVCSTKACIEASNLILNSIDEEADPCDDFYQFSCGNYVKTRRIPSDRTSYDAAVELDAELKLNLADLLALPVYKNDSIATENSKKFFKSCMNEDYIEEKSVESLLQVISQDYTSWPLIDASYDPNNDGISVLEKLVRLRKEGTSTLFSVSVSSNPKSPEDYLLFAGQPSWFYNKKYYVDEKVAPAYKTLIKTVASNLNPKAVISESEIDDMFNLEKDFADALLERDVQRNQTYREYTLNKLQNDLSKFDWVGFIKNGMFGDLPEINIKDDEVILVNDWAYLEKATEIYENALNNRKRALNNLLVWSFIKNKSNLLPKAFREAQLEFDKVYSGRNTIAARSVTCVNSANSIMPYAVGRLYVEVYFDEQSKKDSMDMIENIRNEFKLMLTENDWMDDISKKAAQEKADFIDAKIGYPDYTYNDTHLNILYQNYIFDEKDYLRNSLLVNKISANKSLNNLRTKRDLKEWISGPAVVNAFYSSTLNQISFPAGILQAPFYDSKSTNYLNYGGIGGVIGHEITHGFDDQGRRYDKNGVFFPDGSVGLWTDKSVANYKEKAQCIIDQYSGYEAKQISLKLNGAQTQGENIADIGGIKEAFRAYRKWVAKNGEEPLLPGVKYNQNQLFFINYAQSWCNVITDQSLRSQILTGVHSPGEFRVIGPTSNLNEFSNAFKCKEGTRNNPKKKCAVW